jgi:hypothetical protein
MCASTRVRLGTVAVYYFYLRCDACAHVWSQPERREVTVRRPYPLIIWRVDHDAMLVFLLASRRYSYTRAG